MFGGNLRCTKSQGPYQAADSPGASNHCSCTLLLFVVAVIEWTDR
jgi:hypothetical protein